MRFALFREVPKRQRRKKRKLNSGAAVRKGSDNSDEEDDDEESDGEEPAPAERMSTPGRMSRAPTVQPVPQDPIWGDDSQDISMAVDEPAPADSPDGTTRDR